MKKIIEKLVVMGDRQGMQAKIAYEYLCSVLKENNIQFKTEIYKVDLPVYKKYSLKADGVEIPCLPTGLTSGKITTASTLTNSLMSSRQVFDTPHINFNPQAHMISRANFSTAPSLAISRDSVSRVCSAQKIEGQLIVKKKKQNTYQILVGNTKNPKNIIFSHFDSVGTGAIDNASGTDLMIELIKSNPEVLKNNLFVFDGNEEVSYDVPNYWGTGYRNFEKKYSKQILKARQLVVVDCIGYAKTEILSGKSGASIIKLAFPIKNIEKYSSKIKLITSDYDSLMKVYHSDADNGENIEDRFLKEAFGILEGLL